ncbi:MAG: polymer-forming cytoskeletal protein [Thermoanaerobaculia bacterium]|nr:polymer-forming cytoskeletal protein [Thermoanaerobaculia bacterium]
MWNKEEQQSASSGESPAAATPGPRRSSGESTRIGPSASFQGSLECDEDLRLEGRLKGEVSVPAHRVVVGTSGKVQADIRARVIEVEGRVVGDLAASERVVVAASGNVEGNIEAPRVSLENGAQFKGSIDMDPGSSESAQRKGPKQSPSAAASPSAGETKTGAGAS